MKITKQAKRQARQLFRLCLVNGLLDAALGERLVQRVIQAKPRGYRAALAYFGRLVQLDYDRHVAKVESATPLPPDWLAGVPARLERVYGPGLEISVAQNPALIGGMRITVGSDVYDGSVQARLAALEESF
jgi:F-type H+-transporting ATPase subunit delta